MINTAILSPTKQESAIVAQTYLNELKDKVSELDIGLLDIKQQVDTIVTILRSLSEAVITNQIEDRNSTFAKTFSKIQQRFVTITNRLRHFITIDWITKGLLLEVTSLMEKMIDEYFLETKSITNWEDLQQELFSQIEQHLSQTLLSSGESEFLFSIEIMESDNNGLNDMVDDPFHLDNPSEALHLFDQIDQIDQVEQDFSIPDFNQDSNPDSHQDFNQEADLTTLFPSIINSLDTTSDHDDIDDIDELGQIESEVVPMPEILADIFLATEEIATEQRLSSSDDETELQGFNWENIDYELEFDTQEDDFLNDAWQQFEAPDIWTSNDEVANSILDELTASFGESQFDESQFDESNSNLSYDLNDFIVDSEIHDFLQNINGQADDQADALMQQESEHQPLVVFDAPDIDTAIEESPIYQNKQNSNQNSNNPDYGHEQNRQISHNHEYRRDTLQHNSIEIANDRSTLWSIGSLHSANPLNVQIPYEYLEKLGDLSEDLVIRKGAIAAYLNSIRRLSSAINSDLALLDAQGASPPMQPLAQNLKHLSTVLDLTEQQAEVMDSDIRHLRQHLYQTLKCPLSSLMARFPRILHDLASQLGKQVDLVVQGADIGVEKVVAEVIAEPLDLLLRYCLQHDIELPKERQQQGKPPQGRIEVIASQSDAIVEIKINNDGRSINMPMPDHLVKLCEDVQQRLQSIGGTFVAHPSMDVQFILTLPNSLSLMRVVLITINRMCLAIPSTSILEVLSIASTDERSLKWRDRNIPIVKLHEALMLNCRPAQELGANWQYDMAQVRNEMPMPALLVVKSDDKLCALQVDSCWGDQDATLHHRIEGDIALPQMFAGAVILGNTQAIALLNPSEVIQRSLGQENKANSGANNGVNNGIIALPNSSDPQWIASNLDSINSINSLSDFFNSAEQSPASIQALVPALSRQIKVLIVESSANVRRYLAMALVKCGFLTEQAQDSQNAIALIKARQQKGVNIDVVITDLEMPQMDGFKFLSSVQADPSLQNLPVVVLTAHNNENDQKLALELGAKASFSKPYREQELIETLKKLVT